MSWAHRHGRSIIRACAFRTSSSFLRCLACLAKMQKTNRRLVPLTFLVLTCLVSVALGISVRKIIRSDRIPDSPLPISQAVQVDQLLYVSGTLGTTSDGALVPGIVNQSRQALDNIGHILETAGSSFRSVVKVNVLLSDMDNYDYMNVVYAEYFREKFPARFAYQVARLPRDALVEIDAVAIVGEVVDVD